MRKFIIACCLFAVSSTAFAGTKIPLCPKQDEPFKTVNWGLCSFLN